MGLDLNALFGQAKDAATTGMNDILKTGGNAGLGYLEGQAVAIISADQSQHEQAAQKAVTDVLNRPSSPGGFGSYMQGLIQNPALKQYGPYVIVGAVVLIGLGLYLRK